MECGQQQQQSERQGREIEHDKARNVKRQIGTALESLSEEVRELSLGTTGDVERVKGPLSPLEFLRNYVLPGKPCIITDALDHWPALHKWSNDYLSSMLQGHSVSVHFSPDGRADALVDPLNILSTHNCPVLAYPPVSGAPSSGCFSAMAGIGMADGDAGHDHGEHVYEAEIRCGSGSQYPDFQAPPPSITKSSSSFSAACPSDPFSAMAGIGTVNGDAGHDHGEHVDDREIRVGSGSQSPDFQAPSFTKSSSSLSPACPSNFFSAMVGIGTTDGHGEHVYEAEIGVCDGSQCSDFHATPIAESSSSSSAGPLDSFSSRAENGTANGNVDHGHEAQLEASCRSECPELLFMRAHVEKVPFSRALELIVGGSVGRGELEGGVAYAQEQNGCFLSEYGVLIPDADEHIPWATEAFGCMPEAVNLWIGNQHSVTSFHKDHYENLYAVVAGEKHFTLLPPVDAHRLYVGSFRCADYVRRKDSSNFAIALDHPSVMVPWVTVDPYPVDIKASENRFPGYFKGPKPFTCTVRAGEILYLPSMWFHHVRQSPDLEGRTIALNFWYDMQFDIKYAYFNLMQTVFSLSNSRYPMRHGRDSSPCPLQDSSENDIGDLYVKKLDHLCWVVRWQPLELMEDGAE